MLKVSPSSPAGSAGRTGPERDDTSALEDVDTQDTGISEKRTFRLGLCL